MKPRGRDNYVGCCCRPCETSPPGRRPVQVHRMRAGEPDLPRFPVACTDNHSKRGVIFVC